MNLPAMISRASGGWAGAGTVCLMELDDCNLSVAFEDVPELPERGRDRCDKGAWYIAQGGEISPSHADCKYKDCRGCCHNWQQVSYLKRAGEHHG